MKYFKSPKGLFILISVLFGVGMLVRFVDVATFKITPAVAVVDAGREGDSHTSHDAPPETSPELQKQKAKHGSDDKTHAVNSKASAPRSFTSAEIEVLQSLSGRRDVLVKRETVLNQREAFLQATEQGVNKKIEELKALKVDIERLLGQQEKAEEDRIISLVKIYENMKPTDAARIFDTLEPDILLAVIGRMKERKVSPVLAKMSPEVAKTVTVQLAKERRLPGDKK